jgi:uncharacterized membrane protein YGL010W
MDVVIWLAVVALFALHWVTDWLMDSQWPIVRVVGYVAVGLCVVVGTMGWIAIFQGHSPERREPSR